MKRIIRIVGAAFVFSLVFLAAVAFATGWLKRQNDQLLQTTLEARSAQFAEILKLTNVGPPPWSPEFTADLGRALGAEIALVATPPPLDRLKNDTTAARWHFDHLFRDAEGAVVAHAQVSIPVPPTVRAMAALHRITALLFTLGLVLLLTLFLLVLIDRRWLRTEDFGPADRPAGPPAEFRMLSHLAARSAQQSAELEKEREERQRAEADAHLKQILLNRALQEKIDMGRDLHDGLIQSLYATGLTIQAGRKALDQDPANARAQIDTALQTLNTAIREVRTYIAGLGSEQLRQRNFGDSVHAIVESLSAVREIATDLRIDEDAARHLSADQTTDLLQIIREAVSNGLRHGHARSVSVRLHRNGHELCLLVHDDGRGFDPLLITRGHGLDNMQARADRLGAQLRCASEPGQGTRLVLTFNAPDPAAQS